jgi:hypothetical protein
MILAGKQLRGRIAAQCRLLPERACVAAQLHFSVCIAV